MKKQITLEEKEEKELNKYKFMYLKGSPQAVKFARRQLVNVFGFDDDNMIGYDDGETPQGEIKR